MKTPIEAIYYYRPIPTAREEKLRLVCARQGIRFHTLLPEDGVQLIGALVGLPGYDMIKSSEPIEAPAEEILLLHQFSSSRLNSLLRAFKKDNIPSISLKAVVTETNANWTLNALCTALQEEREEIMRQNDKNG